MIDSTNQPTSAIVFLCLAISCIGAILSFFWAMMLRERLQFSHQTIQRLSSENEEYRKNEDEMIHKIQKMELYITELSKEKEVLDQSHDNFQQLVHITKEQLAEKMKVLSHDVFQTTQTHFFTLAKAHFDENQKRFHAECNTRDEKISNIISPLKHALEAMDKKVMDIEMSRKEAYGGLVENINKLSKETSFLHKALRHPTERGKWGEMQLKRLVEMAGLLEKCDFTVQETSQDGTLRADMIVTLPNERKIIVDAKVPLEGYLRALELSGVEDAAYEKEMKAHSDHLERHIKSLADKKYWSKYKGSIDFIVLFLPSEALLASALSRRPELLEKSLAANVLIATPSTLMALLHAVSQGWREARVERDIKEIVRLAKEWFDRCGIFVKHFQTLGKALDSTVTAYNKSVQSFESRFLITIRKLAKEQQTIAASSEACIDELDPLCEPIARMKDLSSPYTDAIYEETNTTLSHVTNEDRDDLLLHMR